MKQKQETIVLSTSGQGLTMITDRVRKIVGGSGMKAGLCTVMVQHTSASLVIQENADPTARRDLEAFFNRLVPEGDPLYEHTAEGPDDMPAHVKSALSQTSLSIPVEDGKLCLGTWQGIYLWEHRCAPHTRMIVVHVIGE